MNVISGIQTTASALDAEKTRMDIVAQNIANAQTTRGVDGKPYHRKVVSFETVMKGTESGANPATSGVQIASITDDPTPGPMIYNPGHPDADAKGMVAMPNVNLAYEMVDLISSTRGYEANLAVVRNAKQMAHKALTIGH